MSTNPLRPELKWNRFDTLVALTVALLAIVSALLFYLPRSQSGVLTVVVTVSGQEHRPAHRLRRQRPDAPCHRCGLHANGTLRCFCRCAAASSLTGRRTGR